MNASRKDSAEARGATWVPLGIILVGVVELVGLALLGHYTSLWWVLGVVLVGWVVGVALLVAAGQQSFVRLRSLFRAVRGAGDVKDHMSRPAFTLLAALCFFFPGLLTDLFGLVLLVTPVQKKVAQTVGIGGAPGSRRVLYRQGRGSVIDGEIVVEAERTGSSRIPPEDPPIITQK